MKYRVCTVDDHRDSIPHRGCALGYCDCAGPDARSEFDLCGVGGDGLCRRVAVRVGGAVRRGSGC